MDSNPGLLKNGLRGFTLIESALALFILAFLLIALTTSFSTAGVWLSSAWEKDGASAYAASVVNVLRTYSIEMKRELDREGVLNISDADPLDKVMCFTLDGNTVQLDVPQGYGLEIEASYFEDGGYYEGDNTVPLFFADNLIEVDIDIQWGGGDYRLSTIIGAR